MNHSELEYLEKRYRLARSGAFDWQMFGELAMVWARSAQAKIDALEAAEGQRVVKAVVMNNLSVEDSLKSDAVDEQKAPSDFDAWVNSVKQIAAYACGERSLTQDFIDRRNGQSGNLTSS